MNLSNKLIILFTRVVSKFIAVMSLGAGSTWPGHIALFLNKNFIKDIIKNKNLKVILVAGTNGKTTTAKLLEFIFIKNGKKAFVNQEGANLLNGVATSIIRHVNSQGSFDFDIAIFEIDENVLPLIIEQVEPAAIILLNLFRDQLDRYGEVNIVAEKWQESLKKVSPDTYVFVNGDDPLLYYLGTKIKAKIYNFGIDEQYLEKKEISHDVDSVYCPECGNKLNFKAISYSHLGDYSCTNCGFQRKNVHTFSSQQIPYPLRGIYNMYNTNAAVLLATITFSISIEKLAKQLISFKPTYGRQETLRVEDREVFLLLSKNPTGFNQSIAVANEFLEKRTTNILIVLNDRIPDGRDVSWIWDVDFEKLNAGNRKIFISGDRFLDMGLRMKYAGYLEKNVLVFEDLSEAIKSGIEETKKDAQLVVLSTYSAMLEVRKLLTGRKIL